MALISWEKVLTAKDKDGLGVGSFFSLNRAMLFKWLWRFLSNPNAFWVNIVKGIYGSNASLDRVIPSNKHYASLGIIRSISHLKDNGVDFKALHKKRTGNGENEKFWEDMWLWKIFCVFLFLDYTC